jgi:hypothetical protein
MNSGCRNTSLSEFCSRARSRADVVHRRRRAAVSSTGDGCRNLPVSTGPLAHVARLRITSPGSGRSGEQLAITATIEIASDGARVISSAADSAILITRDGQVVGRSVGSPTSYDVPIVVKAGTQRPAQALPALVRLSGCSGPTSAEPLPPGRYQLIGVLGYRLDALNAAADGAQRQRDFRLVSDPIPISVG